MASKSIIDEDSRVEIVISKENESYSEDSVENVRSFFESKGVSELREHDGVFEHAFVYDTGDEEVDYDSLIDEAKAEFKGTFIVSAESSLDDDEEDDEEYGDDEFSDFEGSENSLKILFN